MFNEKRKELVERVIELLELNGLIQKEEVVLPNNQECGQAPCPKPD